MLLKFIQRRDTFFEVWTEFLIKMTIDLAKAYPMLLNVEMLSIRSKKIMVLSRNDLRLRASAENGGC